MHTCLPLQVVLKPAEATPLTALALAELARRAGMPDGVLNIVVGDPAAIGATGFHNIWFRLSRCMLDGVLNIVGNPAATGATGLCNSGFWAEPLRARWRAPASPSATRPPLVQLPAICEGL